MAVASLAKKMLAMTGNEAAAQAMRQINPDVVAAYPITPATEIVQIFSTFVADGLADTEFVAVESEHSAMSATIGAAAAGGRAMTTTSANGLAFMWEVLYIAAGNRLPIVMPVVNRALSAPINIHCDHSDTMGARDSGWIQLYAENAQEMYHNVLQAVRIAEHPEILLPVMCMMDGFIISHGMENIELLDDQSVKEWVGRYKIPYPLLDVDHPKTIGPLDLQDYYFEHKRQQAEAMARAKEVIPEIGRQFAGLSGVEYGFVEEYMMEDAEMAVLAIGSSCGNIKHVLKDLRRDGLKAGLVKLRVFRPFPVEALVQSLQKVRALAVLDRADSFSATGGPLFAETRSALYDAPNRPRMINYIYGLGGRDFTPPMIVSIYEDLQTVVKTGAVAERIRYLGVRE